MSDNSSIGLYIDQTKSHARRIAGNATNYMKGVYSEVKEFGAYEFLIAGSATMMVKPILQLSTGATPTQALIWGASATTLYLGTMFSFSKLVNHFNKKPEWVDDTLDYSHL